MIIHIDESNYHGMTSVKGQLMVKYCIHQVMIVCHWKDVSRGFSMVTNKGQ